MKRKSVKILSSVLMLALSLSLAACSGADKASSTTSSETASESKAMPADLEQNYVDVTWLKENMDNVVLVDATPEKGYKKGHIEGAMNIQWQDLSNMAVKQGEEGWGVILPQAELEKKIGSFGIDGSKTVVVYNDPTGLGEEGRVFWTFKVAGIENVKMLYGGSPAWENSGGEMVKDVPAVSPVDFKIEKYDDSRLATTEYVKNNLSKIKLVDTRSPEEFNGETNHGENYKGEKAEGHIEGAIPLHYQDLYNDDGTIKDIPELKEIFTKAGLKPEDEIVTYCTVGIRSGFTAEILRMCGYTNVKNYNGSFSEWAGAGLPYKK